MQVDNSDRKLQKHLEQELLEEYKFDDKALYFVKDDEKYDIIPEIINGKNIADYIDEDIFEKLEQLEKEEELREAAGVYDSDEVCIDLFIICFVPYSYKFWLEENLVDDLVVLKSKIEIHQNKVPTKANLFRHPPNNMYVSINLMFLILVARFTIKQFYQLYGLLKCFPSIILKTGVNNFHFSLCRKRRIQKMKKSEKLLNCKKLLHFFT